MKLRMALTALIGCLALSAAGCSQCGPGDKTEKAAASQDGGAADKAQAATPEEEKGPIAVVNGAPISREEFNDMYEKMTRVYTRRNKPVPENVARRHKQNIVNRLIEKTLIEQAVTKAGIAVTPQELDEGLAKYKEMFRTEQNFERYLQSSNTTLEKIKENIRFNKALDKLLEKDGAVAVTDEQMKQYYEENKARYEVKEMVKAAHILIRLRKEADEKEKAEARVKAEAIYKEAKKPGADFSQLAIKHSEGPTGPKGGDLGFFTRGRMAPEFEQVAFGMKPGEISKPVLTQFGYHIIKVFEKKPAGQKSFDEVKDSISKLLDSREKRKRKSDMLRELKKTATIVNNLKLPPMAPGADEGASTGDVKLVPGGGPGQLMLNPQQLQLQGGIPGGKPMMKLGPRQQSAPAPGAPEDAPAQPAAQP